MTGRIASLPWYPWTPVDSSVSVNIREGFLSFDAAEPGSQPRTLPAAGTRAASSPVWNSVRRVGRPPLSGLDYWYGNVIFHPLAVDVGMIASAYTFSVTIWNSFLREMTLQIGRTNFDGIETDIPVTLTLGPLEFREFSVTISMDGPFTIDATLLAGFLEVLGIRGVEWHITGTRGVVWGLRPSRGLKEVWRWNSEVQTAWTYREEILPLLYVPRVEVHGQYELARGDMAMLERMFYEGYTQNYILPSWWQMEHVSVEPLDMAITLPEGLGEWRAGDTGILWRTSSDMEIFEVTAVNGTVLTLKNPVSAAYGAGPCLAMPVRQAHLTGDMTRRDYAVARSEADVMFRLDATPHMMAADSAEQLDGVDVWELPLDTGGSTYGRTISCPVVTLDSGLAPVRTFHARPYAVGSQQVTLELQGHEEIAAARRMLLRRQGCISPFRASTRRQDFLPTYPCRKGSEIITVSACTTAVTEPAERGQRSLLRIELTDGTILYRRIVSIKTADKESSWLALSAPVSSERDLAVEDFRRISFLSLWRLASDEVHWTWQRPEKVSVTFSLVEVPTWV